MTIEATSSSEQMLNQFPLEIRRATQFLACVFRATDPADYRVKVYDIWAFFENQARSAANSSGTLTACYEKLKQRFGAQGKSDETLVELLALPEIDADAVLDVLREQISTPIALLRMQQDERKKSKEKKS